MDATKRQLIDFICDNFADQEGNHPEARQLENYKKDEIVKLIENAHVEDQLENYIRSIS